MMYEHIVYILGSPLNEDFVMRFFNTIKDPVQHFFSAIDNELRIGALNLLQKCDMCVVRRESGRGN